jgi:hypothetical protein
MTAVEKHFLISYYLAPFQGPGFYSQVVYFWFNSSPCCWPSFLPKRAINPPPTKYSASSANQIPTLSHNGGFVENERSIRSKLIP